MSTSDPTDSAHRRARTAWFSGGAWIEPASLEDGAARLDVVKHDIQRMEAQLSAPHTTTREGRALSAEELAGWRRRAVSALNAHQDERRRLAAWISRERRGEHEVLEAALRLLQELRAGRTRVGAIDALLASQRRLTASVGFIDRAEATIDRAERGALSLDGGG